jgi:hypothetical protein
MLRSTFIVIISAFVLASCSDSSQNDTVTSSKYYDDGRAKPVVAISSIVDSSNYDISWSLSEELSYLLKSKLSKNKNIFLTAPTEIDDVLTNSDNPFDVNINWMKERFQNHEFLVFLELLNHNELVKDNITNLEMSMRVRIIDVRGKEPKIVLQECVNDNYYIAKGSIKEDYQTATWGTLEYANSRMGLAHNQLTKELANRISDYIELSKSR